MQAKEILQQKNLSLTFWRGQMTVRYFDTALFYFKAKNKKSCVTKSCIVRYVIHFTIRTEFCLKFIQYRYLNLE